MNRLTTVFLLVCAMALAGRECTAQTFPAETNSYNEAIASMKMVTRMTDVLSVECSTRFSSLQQEIDATVASWKQTNKRAIGRAEAYWIALSKQDPTGLAGVLEDAEAKIHATVAELAGVPNKGGSPQLLAYCKRYFDNLNGWREKTPRLHEILEKEI
jgi:hypothetical protein